ncbi:hypothetical protein [Novipirellula artificiosorum]|uniref:Exostosin family protein n=1 Tax=Novipirellula artificiosorum TaxID=2528016 RepID=A0A5C6DYX7_9BACT|nr:hypothetical protein [Novipirellula artificiosorum]TWU41850.1 hypothetical protein Poly41_01420 [Novipirellula artificiosorum]
MQLKNVLRFPFDIHRANRILANRAATIIDLGPIYPNRPIVLDLYTSQMLLDCGRHFASLAHYSGKIGSRFAVRSTRLMLAGIAHKRYGAEMLAQPHATWIPADGEIPAAALVLSDVSLSQQTRSRSTGPTFEMLIGRDIPPNRPVMPYPMHPATLSGFEKHRLNDLREPRNREGILFAGSQKARYSRNPMQRTFGVLGRLQLLETLRQIQDPSIVLRDSATEPIEANDWLPFLAKHRFFVCCPGVAQPMCHNLIESMSVGTIPLIEYGDRLRPELVDGFNAVCFRGSNGLREAIARIRGFSIDQLEQMSRNVSQTYDESLCGKQFLRSLRDATVDTAAGQVVMPFHSENLFASERSDAA